MNYTVCIDTSYKIIIYIYRKYKITQFKIHKYGFKVLKFPKFDELIIN